MLLSIMDFITRRIRTAVTYHTTVWALNSLSDRDLSDLGIDRSEIKSVARLDTTRRFAIS